MFAVVVTINGYAAAASNLLLNLSGGNLVVLLLIINAILLVAGTVIDGASACLLFTPLIYPAAIKLGCNPVALGVIVVMNLAISNATPPVSVCLAVGCGIGKVSLFDISKAALPYIFAVVLALLVVTYMPKLYMFLPNMM